MSNKGNFSQAMREILGLDPSQEQAKVNEETGAIPEVEGVNIEAGSTSEEPASNDRLNQDFNQAFNQTSAHNTKSMGEQTNRESGTYGSSENLNTEEPAFFDRPGYGQSSQNTFSGKFAADATKFNNAFNGANPGSGNSGADSYNDDEVGTTIITRNTIVEGNIKSFENIELNGKVKGKIDTTKNVGVSGFVQGDIEATDILLEGAQIKGNISSKGALLMDKDTLLVGDVEAQNTRVDGKIKGEVNIGGNGEFLSNSVVVGNITVSNFYVQYGARMQGYINTNFSKNEEDSIFGQIVSN